MGSLKALAFQPGEEKRRAQVLTRCIGSANLVSSATLSYLTQSCKIALKWSYGRTINHFEAPVLSPQRRQFQRTRKALSCAKQLKEVKRLEQRERRIMTHINHAISKELVQFAKDFGMGLRFEDLTGCRTTMKQHKKTKSDAAFNRDSWAFYQLEVFTRYKAIRAGVPVQSVPAAYTSKSDRRHGVIGKRNGDWFKGFDGYRCNADWNASQNIGQSVGFSCPLDLWRYSATLRYQGAVAAMAIADVRGGVDGSPLTGEAS
jgi:IS605 OrfB family transposase